MAQYPPVANQILKAPGFVVSGAGTDTNIDFANSSFRGITITYKASATSGGGSQTLAAKLQGRDANGNYYDIPGAAFVSNAADTSVSYVLSVYPGVTTATVAKAKVQDGVIPANLRLVLTPASGTNPTFTLGIAYTFLP